MINPWETAPSGNLFVKIRNPILIEALALSVSLLIRVWNLTLRYRYEPLFPGLEPRWNAKDIGPNRYVYAFWHENILVPAYRMRNLDIAVLISRHADGQLIARAVEWLGFQTVRGSSTRGGVLAIKGMVAKARKFHLAITPDGPKGPRRKCQQGVAAIASLTGRSVVPFAVGYSKAKRLKSWDQFALPLPFSKVVFVIGEPIPVPPNLNEEDLEVYAGRIQAGIDKAQAKADESAGLKPIPCPMVTAAFKAA